MSKSYSTIQLDIESGVATLTLNRPDKRNALSPEMHREMDDTLSGLWYDDKVRVLTVTGAGKCFCGGMDLQKFFYEHWPEPERYHRARSFVAEMFKKLWAFPKPTIASINGYTFGAGVMLQGVCDLALAAEEAEIGLSEVNFGIFPAGGVTWTMAYNLIPRHALHLILTGEAINGKRAEQIGLVNKAVPAKMLREETLRLANDLCKKNPITLRYAKEVFKLSRQMGLSEAIAVEGAKIFEMSRMTKDEWYNMGIKQFIEKKYKPGFQEYEKEEQ